MLDKNKLLARFTSYAEIDTASDEKAVCFPSTAKQLNLAKFLAEEMQQIGLSSVQITEHGYVLGVLPANADGCPVIGLVAHMDTSCEASGTDVKVQLHEHYNGQDLILSDGNILSVREFPELLNYQGQDIITSDGTTLLGADDKAGICAIISACEYLLQHHEILHGKIIICFTPDEEVGRGTEYFSLDQFKVDFAYTVDGGELGELNYETFNACNANIVFQGVSVHPGSSKHKMRNAVTMAAEWQMALPLGERPEYTEGYEGFYHTLRINGGTDRVEIDMILRDHDLEILNRRKQYLLDLTAFMNQKYGVDAVQCTLHDSYKNMKEYIEPVYAIVERAKAAMEKAGIEPKIVPIRGGTDGARLSEMGIPCPNLFTGGHNFHGRFEYLPLQSLIRITEVIVNLVKVEG